MKHIFIWFLIPVYLSVWNGINGFWSNRTPWTRVNVASVSKLRHNMVPKKTTISYSGKKYPLSKKYYEKYLQRVEQTPTPNTDTTIRAGGEVVGIHEILLVPVVHGYWIY